MPILPKCSFPSMPEWSAPQLRHYILVFVVQGQENYISRVKKQRGHKSWIAFFSLYVHRVLSLVTSCYFYSYTYLSIVIIDYIIIRFTSDNYMWYESFLIINKTKRRPRITLCRLRLMRSVFKSSEWIIHKTDFSFQLFLTMIITVFVKFSVRVKVFRLIYIQLQWR